MQRKMSELKNLTNLLFKQNFERTSDNDLMPNENIKIDHLIKAAVLIPIVKRQDGLNVILTKRANKLKQHPGQIAFPGGKLDKTDASLEATALRETHEEIGINPKDVNILGRLAPHSTVTGFQISPFVGKIKDNVSMKVQITEVAEIFEVPLSYLLDVNNYRVENLTWQNKKRYFYNIPYGPFYIWGATARILKGLAELK
jgi:8-oxo-dGTP pyrophosphatase MutT (NUDIX family)